VRLASLVFSGTILLAGLDVNRALSLPNSTRVQQQPAEQGTPLQLKSRRLPDAVEILIEGAGAQAQLRGGANKRGWAGELRPSQPSLLLNGPQVLMLRDGGVQSVTLDGTGQSFRISLETGPSTAPVSPAVSNDGINLILRFPAPPSNDSKNARLDLTQPGRLPQENYTPSFRPRAVAPPVGDMAVGSMVLRNRGFVQLSGPPVTITARGADARDLLMAMAQMGGYGFAFSSDSDQAASSSTASSGSAGSASSGGKQGITVSFRNEPFARAFNFVLLSAGLQAKVEDRTILVGKNVLSKSIGAQMSKVFRLNQVSASGAADYLANLGAQISKTNTVTITSNEGSSTGTGGGAAVGGSTTSQTTSQTTTQTVIEAYGASTGPLLGLSGVTDSRLGTITLVGDPATIAIAENYLRQLDLRKRQVAIEIRLLDVKLDNDTSFSNSVYYKSPNGSWFISDAGKGLYQTPGIPAPDSVKTFADSTPNNTYLNRLKASISSASSKLLASPTLMVQEGNKAKVEAVTSVITNTTQSQTSGGNTICSYTRENAGLIVPIDIEKIDDNGFVSLAMKPEISVPELAGTADCSGPTNIFNIAKRQLDSGIVRLRDGQTLVLTGIIQEQLSAKADKIPIMGDLPLIGQYFRSSQTTRRKSELVILATPRIIRDEDGGSYGYGTRAAATVN